MASAHPRRTSALEVEGQSMALRKGATFHTPKTPSSNNAFAPPGLPRAHSALDEVVDANRQRMVVTLEDIEGALAKTTLSDANPKSLRDESLPVPRGLFDLPTFQNNLGKSSKPESSERPVLRPRSVRNSRGNASDSGLGSSVGSTKQKKKDASQGKSKQHSATSITRSPASVSSEHLPMMSRKAVSKIHEHILKPLLEAEELKDFQPIILDVPRRIQSKDIICLRDLEKTFVFMAPERASKTTQYLNFTLNSIHCIQATVEYISDSEQIRPGDRPYTNGYFIDLKDQITEYARELAAHKDGTIVNDANIDPDDEIRLHGGIAENGRLAELVRVKKDGRAFSLATGKLVELDEVPTVIKRSLSEEREDEEEIMRSMARRKKNASPEELAPKKCREPGCDKEFKRPCDLTKHEKTHSRPWKCPMVDCKYHEFGWPTEKEMGRHLNDKHSDAPAMYECHFKPCPYKSKRESNCKQHMEKAHGWTYVRTKTPAHKKTPSTPINAFQQMTPPLGTVSTPSSDSYSVPTPPDNPNFNFNSAAEFPAYTSHDDWMAQHSSMPQGWDRDIITDGTSPSADELSPYHDSGAFVVNDEDIYAARAQIPNLIPTQQFAAAYNMKMMPQQLPMQTYQAQPCPPVQPARSMPAHFSPTAQQQSMLYTPESMNEAHDSFAVDSLPMDGIMGNHMSAGGDFLLFPNVDMKPVDLTPMYTPEIPSGDMGFSQQTQPEMFQNLDWTNLPVNPLYD